MAQSNEEEATVSIPSLAILAVLGFFIYRFFFASRNAGARGTSSASRNGLRFTPAQVDQVAQMFPQLNRRDIMWDLHRNRGSVQATTERILMGRNLEPAPPSFQPPISLATASSIPVAGVLGATKTEPDLITRYNLQAKINSKGKEKEDSSPLGWANTKEERSKMLQRRRDEMILAARRKMQEKDDLAGLSTSVQA